jgi:hypothetical protein
MASETIENGQTQIVDGVRRVHYDGYWIKAYDVPADTLSAKRRLIEALTRRLFNHVEPGLNIPGTRLDEARKAFEEEKDPAKRRVKGAMLAGALFNRAADIFRKLVELQELGVGVAPSNDLMRQCGRHLQDALALGKTVLHRTGEEGIDELWGEPFKAFSFPVEEFYRSRYVKIAQAMRDIDAICTELSDALETSSAFGGVRPLVHAFGEAAKVKLETLRTDPEIFEVWSSFVVAGERLVAYEPSAAANLDPQSLLDGTRLILKGKDLIFHITRARVIMPSSTTTFIEKCRRFAGIT